MGYSTKQRIFNKRISNGQKTLKEIFSNLSDPENENQNDSEMLSHTCQNT